MPSGEVLAPSPLLYAGVGSRKTPPPVQAHIRRIAEVLQQRGWVLRSGGAEGADAAFWEGAGLGYRSRNPDLAAPFGEVPAPFGELFRPGREVGRDTCADDAVGVAESLELAAPHHPLWARLPGYTKHLLARNVRIVLGRLPKSAPAPVRFVLCWTPDGAERETTVHTGGTGHTIRVAVASGIPVLNIVSGNFRQRLWDLVQAEESRALAARKGAL